MSDYRVWPGDPFPLGATWDGVGTNFALFTAHAEKVELCLFDDHGEQEIARIPLPEYTHEIWHGYLPDVRSGQLYGYRVYGPYAPRHGHRFNPNKLLIDPYAKALRGSLVWDDSLFGYRLGHRDGDLSFDTRDSARFMPKCQVVDPAFTWGERPPPRPPHETVIYEMHARGFTMRHPEVAADERGTFGALTSAPVVDYLKGLGITAVELLPIHAFVHDRHLTERGLRNFWGYNSIGFFAPHPEYLGKRGLKDLKTFVQVMHDAGIEVILDVVYNHTAEGNHLGPTLSFKGIDNKSYYHLNNENLQFYYDYTGTGNSLELRHPMVIRMVMDSLRYWAEEIRIDGFRFDLASTLAREDGHYNERSAFLMAVAQDPVLAPLKLIAEPWDTGPGGYQVGNFRPGWMEWNDQYRDVVRQFWRGDPGMLPALTSRISGSSDIYKHRGRRPWASVNYVTAHDGFTLWDLVSYNGKHNLANLEGNRDGTDNNHSYNYGVEGPTNDPAILEVRNRQVRNFLALLLLSQGVPMLTAGDELRRTQGGNNNAYAQDNEVSWIDWESLPQNEDLLTFVKELIALRHSHIVFHRHRFFKGDTIPGTDVKDVVWLKPEGGEMTMEDWHDGSRHAVGVLLSGEAGLTHLTAHGEQEMDDTFLLLLNAGRSDSAFVLPKLRLAGSWKSIIDTSQETGFAADGPGRASGTRLAMGAHTLHLLEYENNRRE